jgi:hypothetical protein
MWYDFYPTRCVISIPSPRLESHNSLDHITKHGRSYIYRWEAMFECHYACVTSDTNLLKLITTVLACTKLQTCVYQYKYLNHVRILFTSSPTLLNISIKSNLSLFVVCARVTADILPGQVRGPPGGSTFLLTPTGLTTTSGVFQHLRDKISQLRLKCASAE